MNLNLRRVSVVLLLVAYALTVRAQQIEPTGHSPNLHLTEKVLGVLPGTIHSALQASPGNRHVFTTVRFGAPADSGPWALYRDGVLVGRYDGKLPRVTIVPESPPKPGVPFQFSTDGEHYAFV